MPIDELAARRKRKQSRQSAAKALREALGKGYSTSQSRGSVLDTRVSTAYHEETNSWMHRFSDVRKDDNGFFILREDNPDGWRMKSGDLIQDVALNQTPYWKVISNDQERIDLEPIEPNPLLTGVGAGGYVFQASDFKVLTGEYEQERVGKIIERLESGEQLQIYDVKYLLLGTVPLNFGPNGPQGGWYNVHDYYSNRAPRGMNPEIIMAEDARTLENMGFDVPEAALDGMLDTHKWNQFVESTAQMFSNWMQIQPYDIRIFAENYSKAPWVVEGGSGGNTLEWAQNYFKKYADSEEWDLFYVSGEKEWLLAECLEHPQEEIQMRAVCRALMWAFSSNDYNVFNDLRKYIFDGDGAITVYDRLMEVLGNFFPTEIAVPILSESLKFIENGYIRSRIYSGLGMHHYKKLANYAFKENDAEALKSIQSALLRHGYMPGPGVVQHLLIKFANILKEGSVYTRYYASEGIKSLLRLANKQGVDTTEVLEVLDEYEASLKHNPSNDIQDDKEWLILTSGYMMEELNG